jgi:hypothetical protein
MWIVGMSVRLQPIGVSTEQSGVRGPAQLCEFALERRQDVRHRDFAGLGCGRGLQAGVEGGRPDVSAGEFELLSRANAQSISTDVHRGGKALPPQAPRPTTPGIGNSTM